MKKDMALGSEENSERQSHVHQCVVSYLWSAWRSISACCFVEGKTVFYGGLHPNELKCGRCQSRAVIRFGHKERRFKLLPVGSRKVELVVEIPRLQCKCCGAIRQPQLVFAEAKKHWILERVAGQDPGTRSFVLVLPLAIFARTLQTCHLRRRPDQPENSQDG